MKRFLVFIMLLLILPMTAWADIPDESMRLTVYTSHKEEVYQPIIEEFERRTGVWVRVVSGGTTELLERIAAESDAPAADVMFGGGVESAWAYEAYFADCAAPRGEMLEDCDLKITDSLRFRVCRWSLFIIRAWSARRRQVMPIY